MNQKIWKYEVAKDGFKDNFSIFIPKDSEILCVQTDKKTNMPCIWALVYPEKEEVERFFELFRTGHVIHNDMGTNRTYIGSFQYQQGAFIGHVFERV